MSLIDGSTNVIDEIEKVVLEAMYQQQIGTLTFVGNNM